MPPTALRLPVPTPGPTARAALGPASRRRRRLTRRWLAAGLVAAAGGTAVSTLAPPEPVSAPALVLVHDLPVGAVLGPGDVREVRRPRESLPDGLLRADRVAGVVLAGPVRRGEVLTDRRTADVSLLAGQPAGTLAVSVDVGDPALLAGLGPGVHVDVLARTEDPVTGASTGVERLATDVVVLRTPAVEVPGTLLGGAGAGSATGVLVAVGSATAARLTAAAGRTVLAVRAA